MINGRTLLIAHIGYPTESFKAPLIYNPWFDAKGIDAVVVPMGCRADDYPAFLKAIFRGSSNASSRPTASTVARAWGSPS